MSEPDVVRRFLLEHHPVRGQIVQLESAWQALREHTDYPDPVRDLLGEAMAATVLLASTLKFDGQLTLQLEGDGAVRLLVAQCTHDFEIRGVARFDRDRVRADFATLAGAGRVTATVETRERAARYQGIVPLTGDSLSSCIDAYFATSEQLPTRVRLAADARRAAGVLVQYVPPGAAAADPFASTGDEAFARAGGQVDTLDPRDVLYVDTEALLQRVTAVDDVRLFEGTAVRFRCGCGAGRVRGMLRALGRTEVEDILREQGRVTVTCEFCQRPYSFDAIDVAYLFAELPDAPQGSTLLN